MIRKLLVGASAAVLLAGCVTTAGYQSRGYHGYGGYSYSRDPYYYDDYPYYPGSYGYGSYGYYGYPYGYGYGPTRVIVVPTPGGGHNPGGTPRPPANLPPKVREGMSRLQPLDRANVRYGREEAPQARSIPAPRQPQSAPRMQAPRAPAMRSQPRMSSTQPLPAEARRGSGSRKLRDN